MIAGCDSSVSTVDLRDQENLLLVRKRLFEPEGHVPTLGYQATARNAIAENFPEMV